MAPNCGNYANLQLLLLVECVLVWTNDDICCLIAGKHCAVQPASCRVVAANFAAGFKSQLLSEPSYLCARSVV